MEINIRYVYRVKIFEFNGMGDIVDRWAIRPQFGIIGGWAILQEGAYSRSSTVHMDRIQGGT